MSLTDELRFNWIVRRTISQHEDDSNYYIRHHCANKEYKLLISQKKNKITFEKHMYQNDKKK